MHAKVYRWIVVATFLGAVIGQVPCARGEEELRVSADGDLAWEAVVKASEDPPEGRAIRGRRITGSERLRLRSLLHPRELAAADMAAAFRERHPGHPKAAAALRTEMEQLILAADVAISSDGHVFSRVDRLVRELVVDGRFAEKERFGLSAAVLGRVAYARVNGLTNVADLPALLDMELRDARYLRQALPSVDEVWVKYVLIAGQLTPEKARPVLDEILEFAPAGQQRLKAEGLRWRLNAEGKPFQLAFTAVDGRAVDTSEWRGKVVLVDFWATWCGPCVAEVPKLRQIYDRYHARGFEVVGVSLDTDREALERFQTRNQLPWPQYFDGQGWNNRFVVRYGVSLVPAMWLLDKRGVLRHLDARDHLAEKIEALLSE